MEKIDTMQIVARTGYSFVTLRTIRQFPDFPPVVGYGVNGVKQYDAAAVDAWFAAYKASRRGRGPRTIKEPAL